MSEIKIHENRFCQLINHETLYFNLIRKLINKMIIDLGVDEVKKMGIKDKHGIWDKSGYSELAFYINQELIKFGLNFEVWSNNGRFMFWTLNGETMTSDSIDEIFPEF